MSIAQDASALQEGAAVGGEEDLLMPPLDDQNPDEDDFVAEDPVQEVPTEVRNHVGSLFLFRCLDKRATASFRGGVPRKADALQPNAEMLTLFPLRKRVGSGRLL
ncbi:unnamed protein product [Polarella glacialis]|uniref:Uncharacterized protein n=1 Tax=Polarella glacialis TaxID=89957 RepID=A0A813L0H8_POLGL|nr:unnamed protein product [Polarella glacialis]